MTNDSTTIASYLFDRVSQLDVQHIFGVPGDFNLPLLDFVDERKDIKWVGCCNELNAAYAADGYARVKQQPGVLITTYGVGELSALNGIAGARAESVPLIHIVGMTGRPIQEKNLKIHHVNLKEPNGNTDHLLYMQSSKPFSCCSEFITDVKTAAQQIDNVFKQVVKNKAPGYIYFPVDMFTKVIDSAPLETPIDYSIEYDQSVCDKAANDILEAIYASKNPSIVVDTLTERFNARDLARNLVDKTGFYSYTTNMSKGSIDETLPNFVGVYNGEASAGGIAKAVHESDLVLNLGPLLSDSNTGGFSRDIKDENLVVFDPHYVQVRGTKHNVHFYPVLEKVVKQLDTGKLPTVGAKPAVEPADKVPPVTQGVMSLTEIVESMNNGLMKENDTLLVESGTFQFACQDLKFQKNSQFISQIFYSSIGFTLPATLGALIARREQNTGSRVILVEGDGSAQMTIQEIGTMIRHGLTPVILLLNNDGYSIERAIWGPKREYNDICPNWKWTKICEALGGSSKNVVNHTAASKSELDNVFANLETGKLNMVEVMLDRFDYPWRLTAQIQRVGGMNRRYFEEFSKAHDNY